jgi:hypothetical protein
MPCNLGVGALVALHDDAYCRRDGCLEDLSKAVMLMGLGLAIIGVWRMYAKDYGVLAVYGYPTCYC